MELIKNASLICNQMIKGMLAALKPGMLETQVSSWGYLIGQELGSEEFDKVVEVLTRLPLNVQSLVGKKY